MIIAYNLPLHRELSAKEILAAGIVGLILGTIVLAVFIPLTWLANQARASKAEAMRIRADDSGLDRDAHAQRLETRSKLLGWTGVVLFVLARGMAILLDLTSFDPGMSPSRDESPLTVLFPSLLAGPDPAF
jgi:hypothetical protein